MRCGVGRRYWDAKVDLLREPEPVVSYLDDLAGQVEEGRGLLLLGPVGVGKTAALALIAREAQGKLPGVWYATTSGVIDHVLRGAQMRTEIQGFGIEQGQPYEVDPKEWPLLLLDEFGAAYESDYAMAAFEDYLGWRYDQKMATCVASNLTPERIKSNVHTERMVDRWKQTCRVVVIGGESMRRSDGAQKARKEKASG